MARDDRNGHDDRDDRHRDRRGDRDRERDRERKDKDKDRDRKSSRRSRSRSRSQDKKSRRRSRSESRSRSRSRDKPRRRRSGFDQPPPAAAVASAAAAAATNPLLASVGGLTTTAGGMATLGVASGLANLGALGAAGLVGLGIQPPSQQATRHARRIYVGGLPPTANEQNIATFFSNALAAVGGTTAGPAGPAVVNVYINYEKKFAFVEFRTVEETSNAMALDGIMFEGVSVRVRRPSDYNPAAAAALGPSVPSGNLNLSAIGLGQGAVQGLADANERVFVGGLPYYLSEEQCRELLGSFGPIKSFDLVKDRETGQSKGYGFVVYADANVTDIACMGLNGTKMGDRTLTVRRATEGQARAPGMGDGGFGMPAAAPSVATRIVCLEHAVTLEELANDEEYTDIMDDMRDECKKYGEVLSVVIPRPPAPGAPPPPGLGKVFIEYQELTQAAAARNAMHGRRFGGRQVIGTFLMEDKWAAGQYDG